MDGKQLTGDAFKKWPFLSNSTGLKGGQVSGSRQHIIDDKDAYACVAKGVMSF